MLNSETDAQARERFAKKDRQFAANKAANKWPTETCDACAYLACANCGASPLREGSQNCRKCGSANLKIGRVCCGRIWHHVGDCCTHCGNDERGG